MKRNLNKTFYFFMLIFPLFFTSCKTIQVMAAIGGVVGDIAGVEGSLQMAESIIDSSVLLKSDIIERGLSSGKS